MNRKSTALFIGAVSALAVGQFLTAPSYAQTAAQPPQAAPSVPGAPPARAPKAAAKTAPKPAVESTEPVRTDGTAQLRQRIDQLEEQINEMHVAVGTLDSLAKTGAGRASSLPAAGGSPSGDASARLDGMENRLRALTGQIEQMAQQLRSLESRSGRPLPDRTDLAPPAFAPSRTTDVRPPDQPPIQDRASERSPDRGGERGDAIGGLIRGPGNDRTADVGSTPLPPIGGGQSSAQPRQQPASLTSGNPRETYERAYGSLLRQDYAAAEIGFAEFLAQFPSHELSGNAQYWLGESFYVRGQYKPAANALLKGYQT